MNLKDKQMEQIKDDATKRIADTKEEANSLRSKYEVMVKRHSEYNAQTAQTHDNEIATLKTKFQLADTQAQQSRKAYHDRDASAKVEEKRLTDLGNALAKRLCHTEG